MCILCEISGEMSPYPPGAAAPASGLSADSPLAAAGALVASSGNPYIDGVLSGYKWNGPITYSFPDVRTDYEATYPEADAVGFGQLSFNQMQAVRYILEGASSYVGGPKMLYGSIESFTNLSITDAGFNGADIRLGQSSSANPTAYAYYPSGSYASGDVWFGTNYNYTNPVLGSYQYATHIHELGHALGLKHGHQPGGVSNNPVPADRDSLEFTVMTYRSFIGGSISGWTNEQYGYPQTYMMLDIAALQHMYGADFTVNSGNTIYTWSATTGEMFLNGVGQGQPGSNRVFLTIWDGDGIDTYDMSNYSNAVTIDLSPGSWSMTSTMQRAYLGGGQYARGTVFNALQYQGDARSLIENAIGGSGDDIIAGNSADNALSGGGGNDTLSGGAGIDTLDGGTGSDTMTGGVGNDTYYVDSLSDLIAENLGEGTDSVLVFVSGYTLAANTENGHVATSTGLALTGNGLDNYLVGNIGNDTLLGGSGNDTIEGGSGADTVNGGVGIDTLTGGTGIDTFVFADGDTGAAIGSRDLITDFDPGTDLIDLTGIDADTSTGIVDAFRWLVTAAFDGISAALHYFYDMIRGVTIVEGDVNGDGTADFAIDLVGNKSLSMADFTAGSLLAPAAPAISSFSSDSGTVGDGITSDNTLTLTGTAAANSTVQVYDGAMLLGQATANGSGAWSYTTAALTDGSHSFTATAADAANNAQAALLALNVTVDTAAPEAPVISAFSSDSGTVGDGITKDNTLMLTGTAAANSTVQVYDGATLLGQVTANGSGAWSYTTAALTDGSHSFTAIATDAAGNTSAASAVRNVTVDTAAPSAPAISSFSSDSGTVGDGITNDNTLTLTGTAAANSTVQVYDGATLLGTVTANGSGAWSFATAVLTDGSHSFTATATDAAGNTSAASAGLSVTVDTTAPLAPAIASFSSDSGTLGDGITADNTLTLTGMAAANSTVKVYDGATLLGQVTADGSGAWSYATAVLTDGSHSFTATATDAAGNTGTASAVLSVTVHTAAPSAPAIASFSSDSGTVGDGITNDNTLTLTGTAAANSTVRVYDGATLLGSATVNASGAWSYTTAALADGTHSLTATATDAAGNTGATSAALSVTVDTAAPNTPTISSFSADTGTVGDGITADNTLTLIGMAAANSTVKVYDGAMLLGTVTANGSGAWSFATAVLADGSHSFTATATDAAGNTGAASAALSVTVDTAAPGVPAIASFSADTGTLGDGLTADNTLTLTGMAAANSTVKVYDGATLLGSATANASGAWSYTTGSLPSGAHSFTATATDAAGNTSSASTALSVTVDAVAPLAPAITSLWYDSIDPSTGAHHWKLAGTAEANSTVKVYDGATLLGTVTASGNGAWSFFAGVLAPGAHSITATDIDAAGNTSEVSAAMAFLERPVPISLVLTPVSPAAATSNDGITTATHVSLSTADVTGSTVNELDGTNAASANGEGIWSFITGSLARVSDRPTIPDMDALDNTGMRASTSALGETRGGFEGIVDLDTDDDDIFWGDNAGMGSQSDSGQPALSPLLSSASTDWNIAADGHLNAAGETEHWWLHDNAILDISHVNAATLAPTGVAGGGRSDSPVAGIGPGGPNGESEIWWQNDNGLPDVLQLNTENLVSDAFVAGGGNDWQIASNAGFSFEGRGDVSPPHHNSTDNFWQVNAIQPVSSSAAAILASDWQTALYHYDLI